MSFTGDETNDYKEQLQGSVEDKLREKLTSTLLSDSGWRAIVQMSAEGIVESILPHIVAAITEAKQDAIVKALDEQNPKQRVRRAGE